MTLTLGAWFHTLSPFIVRFTQSFGLRWYGVGYALGFGLGWLVLRWFSRRGLTPMSVQRLSDAMLLLVAGVVLGGRLGYVLFYQPSLAWSFSSSPPWWGVLRIHEGGMSSHGGMLGVIAATYFIARGPRNRATRKFDERVPWLHVLDLMALACTPGLFTVRLANFVNGELLGKIVAAPGQPAPWWSVKFPQEAFTELAPSPEQAGRIAAILGPYRLGNEPDELAYARLLELIQSGRHGAAEAARQLEPLISARHPSQLYQAVAEGLVLGAALWWAWKKPRHAGEVGCWFLIVYGILRIITEVWRLPDANAGWERFLGLSHGQWLSAAMVAAGLIALPLVRRRGRMFAGWAGA